MLTLSFPSRRMAALQLKSCTSVYKHPWLCPKECCAAGLEGTQGDGPGAAMQSLLLVRHAQGYSLQCALACRQLYWVRAMLHCTAIPHQHVQKHAEITPMAGAHHPPRLSTC